MPRKINNARSRLIVKAREFLIKNRNGENGKLDLRTLTGDCNIALGTFYHYFGSKDDLVKQVLEEDWNSILSDDMTFGNEEMSLHDKVRCMYDRIDEFDRNYRLSALEQLPASIENVEYRRKMSQKMVDRIALFLVKEIDSGRVKFKADVYNAAYLLMELFLATSRNPHMNFEELWECMNFQDTLSKETKSTE